MTMAIKKRKKYTRKSKKITRNRISPDMKEIIARIKKHKLRFDVDYEKGIYDLTPKEADIYDDSIDDILTIIKKLKK